MQIENVIYNGRPTRGFNVGVGNFNFVEKGEDRKRVKKNWKLILFAIKNLRSIRFSSLQAYWCMLRETSCQVCFGYLADSSVL